MNKTVITVIEWVILASLLVLVVMNAPKVATVVTSVGGFTLNETSMFTGSGYGSSGYGRVA